MTNMSKLMRPFKGKSGVGVTIGKFMPLHLGHELMIEMGDAELAELTVIVSDEYTMKLDGNMPPLEVRYKIIRNKYAGHRNIRVVMHEDTYGPAREYDQHGTAVDEAFWNYWIDVFRMLAPDATHIVSSDRYGGEMATRLHKTWLPVDPDRELFPVSGTAIRKDPIANWSFISREFRPYFAVKIVALGAESSGKSTLIRDLGKHFNSPAVPEYGRILTEYIPNLHEDDFIDIVRRHEFMIRKACMESNTGLVFVDTEKLITWMYGRVYLDQDLAQIRRRVDPGEFALWILIPPNLPWVDDGTRVQHDQADRQKFYDELERITDPNRHFRHRNDDGFNRIILEETDREHRVAEVAESITRLLGKDNIEYKILA